MLCVLKLLSNSSADNEASQFLAHLAPSLTCRHENHSASYTRVDSAPPGPQKVPRAIFEAPVVSFCCSVQQDMGNAEILLQSNAQGGHVRV